jgi:hypothetical protein
MKKIIYILLIAFSASMTLSSCTEEEVTPQQSSGVERDPIKAKSK